MTWFGALWEFWSVDVNLFGQEKGMVGGKICRFYSGLIDTTSEETRAGLSRRMKSLAVEMNAKSCSGRILVYPMCFVTR